MAPSIGALGALSIRRLEERNVIFSLPGADTFGAASAIVDRYERGRIASMTLSSVEGTAKDDQAPLYKIADIKLAGVDMTRMIAALSSDKWQPGAPTGRAHVDSFNASGFSGDAGRRRLARLIQAHLPAPSETIAL